MWAIEFQPRRRGDRRAGQSTLGSRGEEGWQDDKGTACCLHRQQINVGRSPVHPHQLSSLPPWHPPPPSHILLPLTANRRTALQASSQVRGRVYCNTLRARQRCTGLLRAAASGLKSAEARE